MIKIWISKKEKINKRYCPKPAIRTKINAGALAQTMTYYKNHIMVDFRVGPAHEYGGMSNFIVLLLKNLWYNNVDVQTFWRQWYIPIHTT